MSKTIKIWVNWILSMIYDKFSKSDQNQKICSSKIELEWLLMKFCEKYPFPILLFEIIICKGWYFPKTSKYGSNAYHQWSMVSSPNMLKSRKFWSLELGIEWLLMKFYEKNVFSFISGDTNPKRFIFAQTLKTWFKWIQTISYDKFSNTDQTQGLLFLES